METAHPRMIGETILPCEPLTKSYIHTSSHETLLYTTMGQLLDNACEECPDHEAFVVCDTNERLTYRQIKEQALKYARGFLAIGLKKGDVICLSGLTNSDWLFLYFAAAYIGLVIVVAPFVGKYESTYGLVSAKAEVRLVIVGPRDCNEVSKVVSKLFFQEPLKYGHKVEFIYCQSGEFADDADMRERKIKSLATLDIAGADVSDDDFQRALDSVLPDDPYVLLTTSGTTGLPKLVTHRHSTMCNMGKFNFSFECPGKQASSENPGIIATLSIWGDPMVTIWFIGVGTYYKKRVKIIFLPGDEQDDTWDLERDILQILEKERCTQCFMWPLHYITIANCPNIDKYDLSCMRLGQLSAQKCSPELFDRLFKIFPDLLHVYGCTETQAIGCTTKDYPDRETRIETVGHAPPFYEIKVIGDDGQVVAIDSPGEICVKGWAHMHSYWNDPELTKKAFINGWYHTGDMGTMNSEGMLRVLGRKADSIRFKRYGDVVYPAPIEEVILDHPTVKGAQVVGIPCDEKGEQLIACIIVEPGQEVTEDEIREHCMDNLPLTEWVPDKVLTFTQFPKVGGRRKVSKKMIREIVEEMLMNQA